MNYRTTVKGALALSLSLTVASAMAATTTTNSVPTYGVTFESALSTVAPLNDKAYALDSGITNATYRGVDAVTSEPIGWLAADEDESKIIAGGPTGSSQALQLNTDANTLTNKFASDVATAVNNALANEGTAFFETEVKFVASDTLDAGITGGTDATKFAIYAYSDDQAETVTTNLVVFHAYVDLNSTTGISYTNDVTDIPIDVEKYAKLRIEMKQVDLDGEGNMVNAFSVKIDPGDGTVRTVSTDTAFDEATYGVGTGSLFLTVEKFETDTNKQISCLNFKGTGEIDNIAVGTVSIETAYAVNWTVDKVAVSNTTDSAAVVEGVVGDYAAGTTFTFYPTEGTITNVNGVVQDPGLASWELVVGSDTNVTVYAGVAAEPPAGDDYEAGNTVGGVTISAGMATWLNGLKGQQSKADFEATFDHDDLSLTEEYLLNTDPTVDTTAAFTISSIAVGDTVDLQVTLTRTEDNQAVTAAINGALKIYGAASLDAQFAAVETLNDKFSGTTTASTSLTTQSKFFKAVIEEAAAPAAQGGEGNE